MVGSIPEDLDLAVLAHLRGYPEDLRRFANLMKQAHTQGRTASQFFLDRPVRDDSFVAALCRFVQAGEDVVTVVEAAEILSVAPTALLGPSYTVRLPRPLFGEGRHQLWRRAEIVALREAPGGGAHS